GVRVAARRRRPDPAYRPGLGARDVQPAPPRAARCDERTALRTDPAPPGLARALRAAQQSAFGAGVYGLRVRLRRGGSRGAGAVGGAVRRLPQRRGGAPRPGYFFRAGEVGPDVAADAAVATRVRGPGTRALECAAGAVPRSRRRRQYSSR